MIRDGLDTIFDFLWDFLNVFSSSIFSGRGPKKVEEKINFIIFCTIPGTFGTILGDFWGHFRVILVSLWDHFPSFWVVLVSFCPILRPSLSRLSPVWGHFYGHLAVFFGDVLGQ